MRTFTASFFLFISVISVQRPAAAQESPLAQLRTETTAELVAPPVPLPPLPGNIPGRDVSAAYDSFFSGADATPDAVLAARLNAYKVIFIPGFLSDFDPSQIHIPGISFKPKIYFDEQMNWLNGLGVEYVRLKMTSEDSVAQNAPIVKAAIEASDKPVILITHSKGGLDTLEALISDHALLSKVRGLIALQGPFYGTPVADYVVSNSTLDDIAIKLLLRMGGNKESMINLTCADRGRYMAANAAAIAQIEAAIPVLTVAAWKDPVQGQPYDTTLAPVRDFLLKRGLRSDGLVPVESALLPGSSYVKIAGLDHTVTVRPSKYISLDRVKLAKALLLTLFQQNAPGGASAGD
jgi:hypothetical protein